MLVNFCLFPGNCVAMLTSITRVLFKHDKRTARETPGQSVYVVRSYCYGYSAGGARHGLTAFEKDPSITRILLLPLRNRGAEWSGISPLIMATPMAVGGFRGSFAR